MNRITACCLFCFSYLLAFSASAENLFEYQAANILDEQDSINLALELPSAFSAKINEVALDGDELIFNLPHRLLSGVRKDSVGEAADRITPYSLVGQRGFAAINSKNNRIDNILIFDQKSSEVFKGISLPDGTFVFRQIDIDEFICVNFENETTNQSAQTASISYYQSLNNLTFAQVTSLQSRPGASKVLYIDYLAGTVSGTAWNTIDGAPSTVVYDNYSYDSDASTFSLIDLQSMYAGWAETAEDFAPFDVNVTTDLDVYNSVTHRNKSKIIATSTNWFGGGGVAYVDIFGLRNDDFYNIGWTFNRSFGSMGMTNAHEAGHQMGLSHDGTSAVTYYSGSGNSGPIMGAPFGKDFVHWNNGSYPDANQFQNDLSIIQGKLGVVTDDHGDDNGSSSELTTSQVVGLINPQGLSADKDVFNFTLDSTTNVNLTVRALFAQANSSGSDNTAGGLNLSAKIELRNSSNALIQEKTASSNAATNDFTFSGSLSPDTYFLSISAEAYSGANFNEYGNGGYYQILNDLDFSTGPDLIVDPPSVSDDSLEVGQSFQLNVSVKNAGNQTSDATTLTYFRSSDSTISTSDTNIGTDGVESLDAQQSGAENIDLLAPTSPGTYYYGACVGVINNESDTTNNCSAGVLVTVGSYVDLIVESPLVNNAALTTNQEFSLSASVKNQGSTTSPTTSLTYYRSTDSTISTGDISVGSDSIAALTGGTSSLEIISLSAPGVAGTYYYGACVASVTDETDTSNNCSSAVLVTVMTDVDLVVESPAVTNAQLTTNQMFSFSASVKNQGSTTSPATSLIYYRSTDSTISTGDTNVGSDSIAALTGGTSSLENISLSAPSVAGTYYYGACVASVNDETDTSNNCSSGVIVGVTVPVAPDDYEPDDDSANAATIMNGETQSHSIHNINDQDWLRFDISAETENLIIETNGSSLHDTRVWLFDSDLTEIAFSDDDGDQLFSKITLDSPLSSGTYYILVDEYNNDAVIDDYSISLSFDSIVESEDITCLPIKSSNEKIAVICL